MLEIRDINLSFSRKILYKVCLSLYRGEVVGLVGKSGEGKSSLLNVIAGFLSPSSGEVWLDSKKMPYCSQLLIPGFKEIAIVNQDFQLDPFHTVEENIREKVLHLPRDKRDKRVEKLLKMMELSEIRATKAHLVSGGEKQRIAIARAIANPADFLLLDEPFGHLDGRLRQKIGHQLLQLAKEENRGILLVSHDGQDVLSMSDRICLLKNGKLSAKKESQKLYYDTRNIKQSLLFGPVNSITWKGEKIHFRPDEYSVASENGIPLHFSKAVFVGSLFHNYFYGPNEEEIVLYHLEPLHELRQIHIRRR